MRLEPETGLILGLGSGEALVLGLTLDFLLESSSKMGLSSEWVSEVFLGLGLEQISGAVLGLGLEWRERGR